MKSRTKIDKQLVRKTNSELVETIILAKKKDKWLEVAGLLSSPRANRTNINLDQIDNQVKEGETILIAGKVLSQGELTKKVKIIALSFSNKAKEKILKAKGETSFILDEIKKNPEAKGLRVLK